MSAALLLPEDIFRAAAALPAVVGRALVQCPSLAFVAGGHVRSVISGERRSDVDVFASSLKVARRLKQAIGEGYEDEPFETDFAWTFTGRGRPVQIIHAWTFNSASELLRHFDFTVAQACIWWDGEDEWQGQCSERFYSDLAGRRIHLSDASRRRPALEEGGTLMRLAKYSRKGYSASPETLAAVATAAVDASGGDRETLIETLRGIDPESLPPWMREI